MADEVIDESLVNVNDFVHSDESVALSMILLFVVVGVEDCLLVNIYVPKSNPETKMPVMVWIHGGSLIFGSNRCSRPFSRVSFDKNYRYAETGPQHFMERSVLDSISVESNLILHH